MPDDQAEELFCPLCDYNLQGLVEPRCPECGYGFTWEELRDPARRLHPYLFEHHPRRNVRSLLRTLLGGMRPRRFWANLFPTQPASRRRLILYFVLILLPAALALLLQTTSELVWGEQKIRNYRLYLLSTYYAGPAGARTLAFEHPRMTLQQAIDLEAPLPTWHRRWGDVRRSWDTRMVMTGFALFFWPMLTLAALMIFRISMRRARVRPIHALRCVIYSSDVLLWVNLMMFVLAALWLAEVYTGVHFYSRMSESFYQVIFIALIVIAALLFPYRMVVAIRTYLRFDHAWGTVLATQMMVALIVLLIYLRIYNSQYP